jgi:hypothetical protein
MEERRENMTPQERSEQQNTHNTGMFTGARPRHSGPYTSQGGQKSKTGKEMTERQPKQQSRTQPTGKPQVKALKATDDRGNIVSTLRAANTIEEDEITLYHRGNAFRAILDTGANISMLPEGIVPEKDQKRAGTIVELKCALAALHGTTRSELFIVQIATKKGAITEEIDILCVLGKPADEVALICREDWKLLETMTRGDLAANLEPAKEETRGNKRKLIISIGEIGSSKRKKHVYNLRGETRKPPEEEVVEKQPSPIKLDGGNLKIEQEKDESINKVRILAKKRK